MDNRHLVLSRPNLWATARPRAARLWAAACLQAAARLLGVAPAGGSHRGGAGARAASAPMRSLKRRLYGLAFTVARFLVVENGRGIPLHCETRRRGAVLNLGGLEQRPTRARGPRRSIDFHGCTW
jgi:hypothetical protein